MRLSIYVPVQGARIPIIRDLHERSQKCQMMRAMVVLVKISNPLNDCSWFKVQDLYPIDILQVQCAITAYKPCKERVSGRSRRDPGGA